MKRTREQILANFESLARGNHKTTPEQVNGMRRRIVDFAKDHDLVIHPARGYEYYIETFVLFNRCACDKNRNSCPCEEANSECQTQGWCKCHLFWKDLETYKRSHLPLSEVNNGV